MQAKLQTEMESVGETPTKKKPVWQTQVGAFSVSIWENRREIEGKDVVLRNVSFCKRYRDRDGEMQSNTIYPRVNEIPKAIIALQKAYVELTTGNRETKE